MKRLMVTMGLVLAALGLQAAKPAQLVNRVEPAFWFTGFKETSLQLMVYGENISSSDVSMGNYPGVNIQELVRMDSPNYLLVYLNVNPSAQPGTLQLTFSRGKDRQVMNYELRARAMAGAARQGFDASDVLYMLMPDRFANGNPANDAKSVDRKHPSRRHGGDMAGLQQHLDYFTDLGVTALWFTPVLENADETYHGYATTNYYNVDPRYGTNDEYKTLIDACHQRNIKVVMDMIFNHCGFGHPWVKDIPAKDWFNTPDWLSEPDGKSYVQTSYKLTPTVDPYASKIDLFETTDGWFVKGMPDLNQRNRHVMRYLVQNSKWWIETVGIDGIRMDTYPYADRQAMADWMKEMNEEYPNFNTVGESWVTEPAFTAAWQKDSKNATLNSHLKTVMDFSFFDKINQAMAEETTGEAGLNRVYNNFVYDYLYPDPLHVMAFLENHDTDRFLKNGQDMTALKQALTLLLTTRRIPQLYYGTEVLMNGTKEITDGYVRKDFPGGWPGDEHNCFTAQGRTKEENEMYDYTKNLLKWRKGSQAIAKGSMVHFLPYQGCYVYARQYQGETVLVVLNGTSQETELDLNRYQEIIGTTLSATDVISGKKIMLQGKIKLAARQSLVLPF